MKRLACMLIASIGLPSTAGGQTLMREVEFSAGRSSDELTAGGAQARLFGTVANGWRVYLEASWAGVTRTEFGSDAFGSAFPYDRRLRAMEAFVEKVGQPRGMLLGVRAGRFRVPFGIYGRSEHGYSGFTRAPLIRYEGNWALSNNALEAGAAMLFGVPALSVETSVGTPLDASAYPRPRTLDASVRVQAFHGPFIVGASYLSSRAHAEGPWVEGRTNFGGLDGRWMLGGVQVRGEWLFGQPWRGVATRGGYVDVTVHRRRMGPVTAVLRAERLDYDANEHSAYIKRYAAGARVRLTRDLSLQINVLHQPDGFPSGQHIASDVGLTHTVRF
jgi:hypothetical protein